MKQTSSGFTIVELLVVIVVIGILAAITIVSYNNIQSRAYNTQVITGVSQYRKLIESYKLFEGHYPRTSKEISGDVVAMACLGTGYPDQFCGRITWTDTYEDDYFNNELAKVGKGGAIAPNTLVPGPESFIGAAYGVDRTDFEGSPTLFARSIQYALMGDEIDCGVPGARAYRIVESPPVTACTIILEPMPSRD